jgi:Kdo2-lipid IVA lauroyltransferase/acyltransferase
MAKERSAGVDYVVYLAVRVLVCVVQAVPLGVAEVLAAGIAWVAYHLNRRHRAVAVENLRHAFPTLSDNAIDRRVRAVYQHFCLLLIEIIHLPRKLHSNNWRRFGEYAFPGDTRRILECLQGARSVLFVTGHFGNWEMGGYLIALLGFKVYGIARPLDNPYLDRYLRRFREATGQKILAKKGDFDNIEAVLASGGILGTLADQDAGQRGLFVDFFGRPASTHKAVALLALEHRVPLVVTGAARVGRAMCYRVFVEDIIWPDEYAANPDAVRAITQRFTSALERLVRRFPDQYFWVHRRWKHQPVRRKSKAA